MTSKTLRLPEALVHDISEDDLDFSDMFLYNEDLIQSNSDKGDHLHDDTQPPLLAVPLFCADIPSSDPSISSRSMCSPPTPDAAHLFGVGAGFHSSSLGHVPAPSPRIEITPSADSLSSQPLEPSPSSTALGPYRDQPCASPASSNSSTGCSPSISPCISPATGGTGLSALDLCPDIQGMATTFSAHSSPGASPRTSITEETFLVPQHPQAATPLTNQRSRSASPKGKRLYDEDGNPCLGRTPVKQRSRSPSPSPTPIPTPTNPEHHGAYQTYHYQVPAEPKSHPGISSPSLEEIFGSLISGVPRAAALPKFLGACYEESCAYGQSQCRDSRYGEGWVWNLEPEELRSRTGAEVKPDIVNVFPHMWPHYVPSFHEAFSGPPVVPGLSSLECPLPSQCSPYELLIQQQPRSHHRAHYETEGSRGAVKTPNGGHPVVQLLGYRGTSAVDLQVFIGMADDGVVKPHPFYQVHRITGKTVTTASRERMVNGTKVLEIPLEPSSHVTALIDCAGILKLRNVDIEQRNSEMDIGRKNTRVRLVFRVHVPEPQGGFVSLQVASHPIECSQRSAQELPAVERQDLDCCSVIGGQQMVLTGQNFISESKVMFSEKTQDGQQIWEVEANVNRDKTQPNMIFVEVPPYHNPAIYNPTKVNFYVVNGKKKRSQPQHFIYSPLKAIKTEPFDYYDMYGYVHSQTFGLLPKSHDHHSNLDSQSKAINLPLKPYHVTNPDPVANGPQYKADDLLLYPSKITTLNNNPILCHTSQHLSYAGENPTSCIPEQRHNARLYSSLVSHLSTPPSIAGHCFATAVLGAKLERVSDGYQVSTLPENDSFEARLVTRHPGHAQFTGRLGNSPLSRCVQGQASVRLVSQAEQHCQPSITQKSLPTGRPRDLAGEKVTVKQQNPNQLYLEDVNDIIRRDMEAHSGEEP